MVVLGTMTAFYGARMGHKQNWPNVESATLVNVAEVYVFAAIAIAGILLRKRPEAHRRLMSLSFMTLLPPALARSPLVHVGPLAVVAGIFAFISPAQSTTSSLTAAFIPLMFLVSCFSSPRGPPPGWPSAPPPHGDTLSIG